MRKKTLMMPLRPILVPAAVFAAYLLLSNYTRMVLSRETNLFLRDEG